MHACVYTCGCVCARQHKAELRPPLSCMGWSRPHPLRPSPWVEAGTPRALGNIYRQGILCLPVHFPGGRWTCCGVSAAADVPGLASQGHALQSQPLPTPGQNQGRAAPTRWSRWSPGAAEGRTRGNTRRTGERQLRFPQLTSLPFVVFPFLKSHVDSWPRFCLFDDRGFYSDKVLSTRQGNEQ